MSNQPKKTNRELMNEVYEQLDQKRLAETISRASANLESYELQQKQGKDSSGHVLNDLYTERMERLKKQPPAEIDNDPSSGVPPP